jgi:uroporphyrinogen-III synthase
MSAPPLEGLRVVVTRARKPSTTFAAMIATAGGIPIVVPMLEIVGAEDDDVALADTLEELREVDWLAVTSPEGARVVVSTSKATSAKVAVVGPGTAAVFVEAGWDVDFMPPSATAEAMATEFPDVAGDGRVVVAQGDIARTTLVDGLLQRGYLVDVIVVYRNRFPGVGAEDVDRARAADRIVFASPSAVRRYVQHVGATPKRAVCIGPVTGKAATDEGFDVTIAATADMDAIVAALT